MHHAAEQPDQGLSEIALRIRDLSAMTPAGEGEEWVDFDGATYVEHEGEVDLLPGIRLLPAPGHTDGHQAVVVETDAGTNVLGGDVGTSFNELVSGTTDGQRRVLALAAPTWLTHADGGPKVPRPD